MPKEKVFTAEQLYKMTKYGSELTDDQIKDRSVRMIDELIESRVRNQQYTLLLEIKGQVKDNLEYLKSYYSKLGFGIDQLTLNPSSKNKLEVLIINWYKNE